MKLQEALILKVTPYQERDKIVQLYTPSEGKVSAYIRGSKKEPLAWLQPITLIQCLLWQRKGALLGAKELVLIHPFTPLRENLAKITAASQMTKTLGKSQHEGHPNPLLFTLYKKMLYGMEKASQPQTIAASFIVKLLAIEGHFSQETPYPSFAEEEWQTLLFLLNTRSLEKISAFPIPTTFYNKTIGLQMDSHI